VKPHEYRDLIAAYIDVNYGPRGVVVYTEVSLGKTIIGKNRKLDVFALRKADQRALALEAKYQEVQGTTDEKIPYALQDLEALWIPGCLAYAGPGWSKGVLHTLEGSRRAVHCLPERPDLARTNATRELALFKEPPVVLTTEGAEESRTASGVVREEEGGGRRALDLVVRRLARHQVEAPCYTLAVDLFTPVVPAERQHLHFQALLASTGQPERDVLRRWADGFRDRDGKFVIEFQTTFNSCFWELYLNAALTALGFDIAYEHPSPDFACAGRGIEFTAEAAVASHADGFAAEWQARPSDRITAQRRAAMLEYQSVRLANAFDGKLKKYRKSYARLPHVAGKPFVVCLAPFEQPQSYALGDRALRRLLYAYDMPIYVDDEEEGTRTIFGETVTERIWKASGAEVDFGLFTDDRAREVSAVIYSSVATFGKVQVLAAPSADRETFVSAVRYNDAGMRPHLIRARARDYEETLLDGLHVFLNPNAAIPLDSRPVLGREIAVHAGFDPAIRNVRSRVPDGFLFSRSTFTMRAQGSARKAARRGSAQPAVRARMPEVAPWPDGELRYVGGRSGTFTDNHLAHYKGWTIVVARDEIDDDWGAHAAKGTFPDLGSWIDAQRERVPRLPQVGFFPKPRGGTFADEGADRPAPSDRHGRWFAQTG
jgi:hypothetical protein